MGPAPAMASAQVMASSHAPGSSQAMASECVGARDGIGAWRRRVPWHRRIASAHSMASAPVVAPGHAMTSAPAMGSSHSKASAYAVALEHGIGACPSPLHQELGRAIVSYQISFCEGHQADLSRPPRMQRNATLHHWQPSSIERRWAQPKSYAHSRTIMRWTASCAAARNASGNETGYKAVPSARKVATRAPLARVGACGGDFARQAREPTQCAHATPPVFATTSFPQLPLPTASKPQRGQLLTLVGFPEASRPEPQGALLATALRVRRYFDHLRRSASPWTDALLRGLPFSPPARSGSMPRSGGRVLCALSKSLCDAPTSSCEKLGTPSHE